MECVHLPNYQTNGNHDEVRILTGKKGDFACENVGKIIIKIISLTFIFDNGLFIIVVSSCNIVSNFYAKFSLQTNRNKNMFTSP